jgi:hypothetical protein
MLLPSKFGRFMRLPICAVQKYPIWSLLIYNKKFVIQLNKLIQFTKNSNIEDWYVCPMSKSAPHLPLQSHYEADVLANVKSSWSTFELETYALLLNPLQGLFTVPT